jgi:hypothetical protein
MLKKSPWIFGLAFVLGIACLSGGGFGDPPPQDLHDFVWFTRNVVRDDMDNRDAFTILMPKGWQFDAKVIWRYEPFYPVTCLMSVYNPRGTEAITQYPLLTFNDGIRQMAMLGPLGPRAAQVFADGNYYLGAEIRPQPVSPQDYFKNYVVPRFRAALKDATIVSTEDQPALAKATFELLGQTPGLRVKAACIHTQYQASGVDVEEDFIVTLAALPLPGNTVSWSGSGFSYRAKKGTLKEAMPILRMIQTSVQINISWFNDIEQAKTIMQQIQAGELKQEMIRSRIIAHLQDKISQTIQETFLNRAKVQSKCDADWDAVIRGTETVPDPNHPGVNIHIPVGYDHVFVSGDGTQCIATNGDSFKPDSVNGNFQELHAR